MPFKLRQHTFHQPIPHMKHCHYRSKTMLIFSRSKFGDLFLKVCLFKRQKEDFAHFTFLCLRVLMYFFMSTPFFLFWTPWLLPQSLYSFSSTINNMKDREHRRHVCTKRTTSNYFTIYEVIQTFSSRWVFNCSFFHCNELRGSYSNSSNMWQ